MYTPYLITKDSLVCVVKRISWVLCLLVLLCVLLDTIFHVQGHVFGENFQKIFNMAREKSVQNWYASSLALIIGLSFWLVSYIEYVQTQAHRAWMLMGLLFVYVSVDDAAFIHERIGSWFSNSDYMYEYYLSPFLYMFPSYGWQLVLGPFFLVAAIIMMKFLARNIVCNARLWILSGSFMLFIFAVGIDFYEGLDRTRGLWTHYLKVLEESMEMIAYIGILYVVLRECVDRLFSLFETSA